MFKDLLFKSLVFFGPICLGVLFMYIDSDYWTTNYFTYFLTEGVGALGMVGTILFYAGWTFNIGYIVAVWIKAFRK